MSEIIKQVIRGIKTLFRLFFTLLLIGIGLYIDARFIEPKLLFVKEQPISTDKWSSEVSLQIALFSDVHLGEDYSINDLKKVVKKINALKPDLVIFAGDLIDDNKVFKKEEKAAEVLAEIEAIYGKFAVYGNHDHGGNGTRRYARIMKAANFTLLKDSSKEVIMPSGEVINLIGLDDIVLSKPDFEKAFSQINEKHFNLFISHAPDVVDRVMDRPIDLQLSGHSHGGQVRLPIIGAPLTVPFGEKYIKGLYMLTEKEERVLYVNSGIGTSQLPYRFLNPPEITLITLSGKTEQSKS